MGLVLSAKNALLVAIHVDSEHVDSSGVDPRKVVDTALPDFDCRANTVINDELWHDLSLFVNRILEPHDADPELWIAAAAHLFRYQDRHRISTTSDAVLMHQCPFAFLALNAARWAACFLSRSSGDKFQLENCATLQVSLGWIFTNATFGINSAEEIFPIFMNSRWITAFCVIPQVLRPLVAQAYDAIDPSWYVRTSYDCYQLNQYLDWDMYFTALKSQGPTNPDISLTTRFAFANNVFEHRGPKVLECLLGYLAINLERLRITQRMQTEYYAAHAHEVALLFEALEVALKTDDIGQDAPTDALSVLLLTRWPILELTCTIALESQSQKSDGSNGYQHKPFLLDFYPEEIVRPRAIAEDLATLRGLSVDAHRAQLRSAGRSRLSETFRSLLVALNTALCDDGGNGEVAGKIVFVTMLWGTRLPKYLDGVLQRAAAFGLICRYIVFCLDSASFKVCVKVHPYPSNCVSGKIKSMFSAYAILAAVLHSGFDVIYLDFDIVMFKNPLPIIRDAALNSELLVTRDFAGMCLNTGVIYMKAHGDNAAFMNSLLTWLWHHPYEFSQKAFSAFLGMETLADKPFEVVIGKVPRWSILDPSNKFVTSKMFNPTVEGWSGDVGDIVLYHFLDNQGHGNWDGDFEHVDYYELFYGNQNLNLTDMSVPLWEQDPALKRAVFASHWPTTPQFLHPCKLMPNVKLGHAGSTSEAGKHDYVH